jgi:hypothetical protein
MTAEIKVSNPVEKVNLKPRPGMLKPDTLFT